MNLLYPIVGVMLLGAIAPDPKPPVVPDALRAEFFKAQAQLIQAKSNLDNASGVMTGVVEKLNKLCGDRHQFQMSQDNEPQCVAKIPVVNKAPDTKK